jgi:hypothetical protein
VTTHKELGRAIPTLAPLLAPETRISITERRSFLPPMAWSGFWLPPLGSYRPTNAEDWL